MPPAAAEAPPDSAEVTSAPAAEAQAAAEAGAPAAEAAPEEPKLEVTFTVEQLPGSQAKLSIEVMLAEVARVYKRVYRELSRSGRIPGFRPGKVPRDIVRRKLGAEHIDEQVIAELQAPALEQVVEESGLVPLEPAKVDDAQVAEGQALTFAATLTVRPTPQLWEYKGLQLQRPVTEITPEDLQEELDELLESVAGYEPAAREQVQAGDLVLVDMAVTVGDQQPRSTRQVEYVVGQGTREPKLDEHLVGATKDQTQTVEITYSAEYPDPQLAGEKALVTFTVKEIRERRKPEPTDELAEVVIRLRDARRAGGGHPPAADHQRAGAGQDGAAPAGPRGGGRQRAGRGAREPGHPRGTGARARAHPAGAARGPG